MKQKAKIWATDEWRRHGAVMPACLVGIMLIAVQGYTLGVMIRPLEQEFGWSRAEISTGAMIPSLAAILMAPLVGIAVDRFGPRRIALFGVPFFCLAFGLLSTATANVVSWWVLYSTLGVSSMFIFPTIWTAAINARFDRNRGLALAIALTGTGITGAIFPVLTARLLQSFGWRTTYVIIASMCFLVAFPLVFFLFDRGRIHEVVRAPAGSTPVSLRAEFTSRRYLCLAGAALIFAGAACVLTVNAVPILLGEGFEPLTAAGIAGLVGIGTITGRLCGGLLLDRFDGRFVAAGSGLAPMIGAALLLGTQHSEWAAMAACLALGIAGGTEYDACAYLTAKHFGMRHFGSLFGLIGGLCVFGSGVAPVVANHVYDLTKSYDIVLWAMMPAFAVAGCLFMLMGPYPQSEKVDVLLAQENPLPTPL
jgi:MFS family permease